MRTPRGIYAVTAVTLLLVATVSALIYRATEHHVVSAFSEQQLAVARTVAVALDADAKALAASLRQLNSLPSVQNLEVEFVGQRVQAAFSAEDSGVLLRIVRISRTADRYAWSMRGELLEDGIATVPERDAWTWVAEPKHVGKMRVGPVWWDASAPPHHRALSMPVWRVARASAVARPPNDFNGVLAFVIDARRLLSSYAQPASIETMRGSLSLDLGDKASRFHIGPHAAPVPVLEAMYGLDEGTAVRDGYVWTWAHLPFADRKWGVVLGTPYDVASARVGVQGMQQLGLIVLLAVLVPVFGWLLIRREREAMEERRLLQAQLAQAQKMDAIGKLAGGIAHDFNNLLTAILGYTSIILEDAAPGSPTHDYASQVKRAGDSAAALTQKLLAFSRRQVLNSEHLDIGLLLKEIMLLVGRLVGEHIVVTADLEPDLWPVVGDRVQVEQAIINLAINARDAMPKGGTLEIVARNAPRPLGEKHADHKVQPGDYVQIIVRDSGIGMDDATRARMFEPFFTTKPKGKGTGLGLASVWGIVKQSGGYIHVTTAPNAGTAIELLLPRAIAAGKAAATRLEDAQIGARGTETVLVVDDEASVLEFARSALQRQGYQVLTASGGDEALRVVQDFPEDIQLLVSDVRMPGMQGPELAARLRQMRPGIRVMLISGYAAEALGAEELKDAPLLEKPFTPPALTRAVRQVLDRP